MTLVQSKRRRIAMATQLGALKRIKGFAGFNVDGFAYQSPDVAAYFLTHFHAVWMGLDSSHFILVLVILHHKPSHARRYEHPP